ncbi:MAG: FAD-binding oxidoreductase [Promethearchaeota archaeon]
MDFEIVYNNRIEIKDLNGLVSSLREIVGEKWVSTEEADLVAYSKDYQLITNRWIMDGKLPGKAHVIVWPESEQQISQILRIANEQKIPVIPYGEGSGVVGAAIPVYGGIIIDMKRLNGVINVNEKSLTVTVQTGLNGKTLGRILEEKGYILGHVPQSFYTSTVGGWIALRAAGQFSTKYGKIEDIVLSVRVVLPTGEIIFSKLYPRASNGPQIERLFLGSEGTLGIITEVTMKIWPKPEKRGLISYVYDSLNDSLESIRLILRKGIFPAVIRIYDKQETVRHFKNEPKAYEKLMVIFVCEGMANLVDLETSVVNEECRKHGGVPCGEGPVRHWFETRFNVTESSIFGPQGAIFDTIEVSCMWEDALNLYNNVTEEVKKVPGVLLFSGHASHFYPQGVCFYFTFGGIPPEKLPPERFYTACWDATMVGTLRANGSISHHHGIGLVRSKWMVQEHGKVLELLKKIKKTLDPNNIMNPGKLYGDVKKKIEG